MRCRVLERCPAPTLRRRRTRRPGRGQPPVLTLSRPSPRQMGLQRGAAQGRCVPPRLEPRTVAAHTDPMWSLDEHEVGLEGVRSPVQPPRQTTGVGSTGGAPREPREMPVPLPSRPSIHRSWPQTTASSAVANRRPSRWSAPSRVTVSSAPGARGWSGPSLLDDEPAGPAGTRRGGARPPGGPGPQGARSAGPTPPPRRRRGCGPAPGAGAPRGRRGWPACRLTRAVVATTRSASGTTMQNWPCAPSPRNPCRAIQYW